MWRVEHSGQPAQITAIFDSYGLYQTSPVSPWKSYWSYTFTPKEVTHWVRLRQKDIRIRANSIFIKKEKFGSVCASDFKFHITLAVCGQQSYLRPSRNRRQLRCCGIQSAFCCNILDLIITNQTIVSEILLFIPVVIKLHQTTLHSLSTHSPPVYLPNITLLLCAKVCLWLSQSWLQQTLLQLLSMSSVVRCSISVVCNQKCYLWRYDLLHPQSKTSSPVSLLVHTQA